MKEYNPEKIRNICLASHSGMGKSTLAEAILFVSGKTKRFGSIDDGNSVSDYNADEIDRKFSITTSLMHCEWKGHKINILDTPGYPDFSGKVKGVMRAADLVVIPLKATALLDVGTEVAWYYAKEFNIPVMFVINELDKENSDFDKTYDVLVDRFGGEKHLVEIGFPIGEGSVDFNQIFDTISMKFLQFETDKSGNYKSLDVPDEFSERMNKLHEVLIEEAAESKDEFMEHYFESGTLSDEEFHKGLKEGIASTKIVPVFCTNGLNAVGVKPLLDFIVEYCPSPKDTRAMDARNAKGEDIDVKTDPKAPFSAFVFKTISEPHVGELSLFRVYSGSLKPGDEVFNPNKQVTERIGQIYALNGKDREEVTRVPAGDIAAVVKLKDTHTNNSLCSKSNIIKFEEVDFPPPLITFGIIPKGGSDEAKISAGLHALHEEDPTFLFSYDVETKQSIVSGQGEMHLSIMVKRLKDKFGVEVDLVDQIIPYKETIKTRVKDAEYKHKKQTGGRGQFAHVHLGLEPRNRGEGFEFADKIVGGVVPSRFVPAVEKGIRECLEEGVVAGYPIIDVKATLFDGAFHDVDSDEMSFKIASAHAFRNGFKDAKPVLLEPIYEVDIKVPEEFMGSVMGDVSGRRGQIMGNDADGHFQKVKAQIPLSELTKYATVLRSMTGGRGIFRKKFDHYAEVPRDIAEKLIAAHAERKSS